MCVGGSKWAGVGVGVEDTSDMLVSEEVPGQMLGGGWGVGGGGRGQMEVVERRGAGYGPNSKHWFTTSFLQPLPYLVTHSIGSRKLLANEQFFCWCSK